MYLLAMDPPQEEIDRQMALKHEYSLGNITAFIIAGLVIVTVAVLLRLWARRLSKIPWRSDDYTLMIALVCSSNKHCHETVVMFGLRREGNG